MLYRRRELFLGLFHSSAIYVDNSQTCTWCKVSGQALGKSPCHPPLTSLPYLPSLHTGFRFLFLNTANTKLSSLLKHGSSLPDGPQNRLPGPLLGSSHVFSLLALTTPSLLASQQNRVFNILVALLAST